VQFIDQLIDCLISGFDLALKGLLVLRRENTESGFNINFNLVDIASNQVLNGGFSLTTEQFLNIDHLFLLDR